MNLFMHLGFDMYDIGTYGINLVISSCNNTMIRNIRTWMCYKYFRWFYEMLKTT